MSALECGDQPVQEYVPVWFPDQIDVLRSHWPGLNPDPAMAYYREHCVGPVLPGQADGFYAVVRHGYFSPNWAEEFAVALAALKMADPNLFSFIEFAQGGMMEPVEWTQVCLGTEAMRQSGDIVVVASQFGAVRAGESVKSVRDTVVQDGAGTEYCNCARDVALMLLTNPGRFATVTSLGIVCGGDYFVPEPDTRRPDDVYVPYFRHSGVRIIHGATSATKPNQRYGVVTSYLC